MVNPNTDTMDTEVKVDSNDSNVKKKGSESKEKPRILASPPPPPPELEPMPEIKAINDFLMTVGVLALDENGKKQVLTLLDKGYTKNWFINPQSGSEEFNNFTSDLAFIIGKPLIALRSTTTAPQIIELMKMLDTAKDFVLEEINKSKAPKPATAKELQELRDLNALAMDYLREKNVELNSKQCEVLREIFKSTPSEQDIQHALVQVSFRATNFTPSVDDQQKFVTEFKQRIRLGQITTFEQRTKEAAPYQLATAHLAILQKDYVIKSRTANRGWFGTTTDTAIKKFQDDFYSTGRTEKDLNELASKYFFTREEFEKEERERKAQEQQASKITPSKKEEIPDINKVKKASEAEIKTEKRPPAEIKGNFSAAIFKTHMCALVETRQTIIGLVTKELFNINDKLSLDHLDPAKLNIEQCRLVLAANTKFHQSPKKAEDYQTLEQDQKNILNLYSNAPKTFVGIRGQITTDPAQSNTVIDYIVNINPRAMEHLTCQLGINIRDDKDNAKLYTLVRLFSNVLPTSTMQKELRSIGINLGNEQVAGLKRAILLDHIDDPFVAEIVALSNPDQLKSLNGKVKTQEQIRLFNDEIAASKKDGTFSLKKVLELTGRFFKSPVKLENLPIREQKDVDELFKIYAKSLRGQSLLAQSVTTEIVEGSEKISGHFAATYPILAAIINNVEVARQTKKLQPIAPLSEKEISTVSKSVIGEKAEEELMLPPKPATKPPQPPAPPKPLTEKEQQRQLEQKEKELKTLDDLQKSAMEFVQKTILLRQLYQNCLVSEEEAKNTGKSLGSFIPREVEGQKNQMLLRLLGGPEGIANLREENVNILSSQRLNASLDKYETISASLIQNEKAFADFLGDEVIGASLTLAKRQPGTTAMQLLEEKIPSLKLYTNPQLQSVLKAEHMGDEALKQAKFASASSKTGFTKWFSVTTASDKLHAQILFQAAQAIKYIASLEKKTHSTQKEWEEAKIKLANINDSLSNLCKNSQINEVWQQNTGLENDVTQTILAEIQQLQSIADNAIKTMQHISSRISAPMTEAKPAAKPIPVVPKPPVGETSKEIEAAQKVLNEIKDLIRKKGDKITNEEARLCHRAIDKLLSDIPNWKCPEQDKQNIRGSCDTIQEKIKEIIYTTSPKEAPELPQRGKSSAAILGRFFGEAALVGLAFTAAFLTGGIAAAITAIAGATVLAAQQLPKTTSQSSVVKNGQKTTIRQLPGERTEQKKPKEEGEEKRASFSPSNTSS